MRNPHELQAQARAAAGQTIQLAKTFKDDEPGVVHIDIKYLPQRPDEAAKALSVVASDRAKRWVFLRVYADKNEARSVDFLKRLHDAAPMKITKVLADNGSPFTDRFTSKAREPLGRHSFVLTPTVQATRSPAGLADRLQLDPYPA